MNLPFDTTPQDGDEEQGAAPVEQEVKAKKKRVRKPKMQEVTNPETGEVTQVPVEVKPREKRVKGENEWTPAKPWPTPLKGALAGATIEPLNTAHGKTGKAGQFLDAILSSHTPEEAVLKPAKVNKGGVETLEYMDPGYVRWAAKIGVIKLNLPERPAPQPTAPTPPAA